MGTTVSVTHGSGDHQGEDTDNRFLSVLYYLPFGYDCRPDLESLGLAATARPRDRTRRRCFMTNDDRKMGVHERFSLAATRFLEMLMGHKHNA
jgi:hypothetical protein